MKLLAKSDLGYSKASGKPHTVKDINLQAV